MRNARLLVWTLLALGLSGCEGNTVTVDGAEGFVPAEKGVVVTPAGGELALDGMDGTNYVLTVPAGALREDTAITLSTLAPGAGQLFRLSLRPEGLLFDDGKKASLRIVLPADVRLPAGGGLLYSGVTLPFTRNPDGTLTVELSAFLSTASALSRMDAGRMLATTGNFLLSVAQAAEPGCGGPPASGSDGEGLSGEEAVDVEVYIQCMQAAIDDLEAEDDFESAARANVAIAALISLFGGDAAGAVDAAGADACVVYDDTLATNDGFPLDSNSTLDDVATLRGLMAQLVYWRSVTQALGADCDTVLDFDTVIHEQSQRIADYYETLRFNGDLDDSASATFEGAVEQYRSLDGLPDEAAALGVPDATAPITDVAQPSMVNGLLEAPWHECRDRGDYAGLIRLADAAPDSVRVQDAAQYCGTQLSAEVLDSQGQVVGQPSPELGGIAPGAKITSGAVSVQANGRLRLTGPIRQLACPGGSGSTEDLALTLNGVEVQRAGSSPYFIPPLSLDVAAMIQQAGLTPDQLSEQPLTLARVGDSCGGFWGANPQPLLTLRLAAQRIAFDRNNSIYIMESDGSNQTLVGPGRQPSWSPDGARIAFAVGEGIAVMNVDGSGVTPLSSPGEWPTWSPDGTRIAFTSRRDRNDEIYAIHPDGTGLTNLTNSPDSQDLHPAWSPDGARIAFTVRVPGQPAGIAVMNADGSGQTQLTFVTLDQDPAWSPDGARIVFTGYQRDENFLVAKLYVMNADGSGASLVTDAEVISFDAAWSPGARIVFSSTAINANDVEIFTMDPDGSGRIQLTADPSNSRNPAWSR